MSGTLLRSRRGDVAGCKIRAGPEQPCPGVKVLRRPLPPRAPWPRSFPSPMKMLVSVLFLRANAGDTTWKIMLALAVLRRTGDAEHPEPLRVPGRRGRAHSSRPTECALSPYPRRTA